MTVAMDQISEQIRDSVYALWLLAVMEPNADTLAGMKQQIGVVERNLAALRTRVNPARRVQHPGFVAYAKN